MIDFFAHSPVHRHRAAYSIAAVLIGSLLIATSSLIIVPMYPVPMTMQSWAVLFVAAALGPRLGTAAVMVYLMEGLAGLPVFASGAAGPARFVGPTAGYLLAFPVAAFVTGWLMQRVSKSVLASLSVMLLGHAVILAGGVAWLSGFVGVEKAMAAGLMPFLLGSVVKSALIVAGLDAVLRLVRRAAP